MHSADSRSYALLLGAGRRSGGCGRRQAISIAAVAAIGAAQMWLNDDRLVVGTDTSDLLLIEGQDIRAVRPFVRLFVCLFRLSAASYCCPHPLTLKPAKPARNPARPPTRPVRAHARATPRLAAP